MGSLIWWIKILAIAIVAFFFLVTSIGNLISAYQLRNPLEFVMVFFSQSLMLLISAVGIIYSLAQLYEYLKKERTD